MSLVSILLQQIDDEFNFGFAVKVPIEDLHKKGWQKVKRNEG